jgi:hypothetical protein
MASSRGRAQFARNVPSEGTVPPRRGRLRGVTERTNESLSCIEAKELLKSGHYREVNLVAEPMRCIDERFMS